MGLDQEAIKKRFSQLELDINNMNRMIDDNLQIGENGEEVDKSENEELGESQEWQEFPRAFSQLTGEAAQEFVSRAGTPEAEEEGKDKAEEKEKQSEEAHETPVERVVEMSKREVMESVKPVEPVEPVERVEEIKKVEKVTVAENKEQINVQNKVVEKVKVAQSGELSRKQEKVEQREITVQAGTHPADTSDQATDTSEDFTAGNVTTAISSNSSFSSPAEPAAPIFLPKNTQQTTTLRRPTNPFRVVSVGAPNSDTNGSRKASGTTVIEPRAVETEGSLKLQKRLDYLTKKCLKLRKEIQYLNDMNSQSTLSIEDGRRLTSAIEKLQEYLDTKTKEKYDLGVIVSRQLRRDIDRGDNGQFWIGTK